mgnify:CR=1 FL=1
MVTTFIQLLLMKRGGQVIYSGPLGHHSQNLIHYFEVFLNSSTLLHRLYKLRIESVYLFSWLKSFQNIPGVPKIKDGYNPATWMLEISSEPMEAHLDVNFAHLFENSSLFE